VVDKDSRKIGRTYSFDFEQELLHDYEGNQYLINDAHYQRELQKRTSSFDKEISLNAAGQLLRSNLKQLTDKQKQVVIGVMENKTIREIAIEMNIYFTTAQEHLDTARKKLANLINTTKQTIKEELENE
jgi:DNA-directed RNA polymerase specialized sigma24 family protein